MDKQANSIIKLVEQLKKDIHKGTFNHKKINQLKKKINLKKIKIKSKKVKINKNMKGGYQNEEINNLAQMSSVIQNFSIKLLESISEITSLFKAVFPNNKTFSNFINGLIKSMKFNHQTPAPPVQSHTGQTPLSGGAANGVIDNNILMQLGQQHIQSMVFMSEVVKYISMWINQVNSIIINNQLGMSDDCLENAMRMIQSLADLTKSFKGVVEVPNVTGTSATLVNATKKIKQN